VQILGPGIVVSYARLDLQIPGRVVRLHLDNLR